MPQLRRDPIMSRWVIISTDRKQRPTAFKAERHTAQSPPHCPFCPGNERHTAPEIVAYRDEATKTNDPGWHTRVIPNRIPVPIGNLNLLAAKLKRFALCSLRHAHIPQWNNFCLC